MVGSRPVTVELLDAHLRPIREDVRGLEHKVDRLSEQITAATATARSHAALVKSRQFWVGTAVACGAGLVGAIALLVQLIHHG